MAYDNNVESRVSGEYRPRVSFYNYPARNRPFSTGAYTDPRIGLISGMGSDYRDNYSLAGTYANVDLSAKYPYESMDDMDRAMYNKAYGPGASSSIPAENKRESVARGARVLSSTLKKRKDKREGGSPAGRTKGK